MKRRYPLWLLLALLLVFFLLFVDEADGETAGNVCGDFEGAGKPLERGRTHGSMMAPDWVS